MCRFTMEKSSRHVAPHFRKALCLQAIVDKKALTDTCWGHATGLAAFRQSRRGTHRKCFKCRLPLCFHFVQLWQPLLVFDASRLGQPWILSGRSYRATVISSMDISQLLE